MLYEFDHQHIAQYAAHRADVIESTEEDLMRRIHATGILQGGAAEMVRRPRACGDEADGRIR
jgi:hypothetical protein